MFEHDNEIAVAEPMFNVATRHVDEWVGHVGREDPWEDVAKIFGSGGVDEGGGS